MGKAAFDHTLKLTPEQRAAGAERARGLRLFGERLGLNKLRNSGVAEELKAGTALPRPQEPTQQPKPRKRAAGGGAKRKLSDDMVERGKSIVRRELDLDPGWASHFRACCELVKHRLTLTCHWQTVDTWIVRPVLIERGRAAVNARMEGPVEK
jgi:hypothetical protein